MAFFADNALQGRGGYSWGGQAPELVIQRSLTKTYQARGRSTPLPAKSFNKFLWALRKLLRSQGDKTGDGPIPVTNNDLLRGFDSTQVDLRRSFTS